MTSQVSECPYYLLWLYFRRRSDFQEYQSALSSWSHPQSYAPMPTSVGNVTFAVRLFGSVNSFLQIWKEYSPNSRKFRISGFCFQWARGIVYFFGVIIFIIVFYVIAHSGYSTNSRAVSSFTIHRAWGMRVLRYYSITMH